MAGKAQIGASIVLDGEKAYREAVKGIYSEQKVLTSEMKLSSETFKDSQNSIEALTSKHTILSKQVESQAEKVKIYSKAVEDSAEKEEKAGKNVELLSKKLEDAKKEMDLMSKSSDTSADSLEKQQKTIDDLSKKLTGAETGYQKAITSTNKWQTSLNGAETDLIKMSNELDKTDKYLDEAKNSTDKAATSIDNMGKQINEASDKTLSFGDVLKANVTGAAIVGGVTALARAFENVTKGIVDLGIATASYADNMLTMSTTTGISTDNLQAYNYMAELTDTSLETLTGTMVKNTKSMYNAQKGTEDYVNAYGRLNVEYEDGNGALLDSETVYWNIIDALGKMTNETERDATAMVLLGKSAQDVNTLVALGSDGVKGFTNEAKNMGAILDTKTLASLGETDDALQRFTQTVEITKRKVGAEMAPALTEAAEKISEKITEVDDELADFASGTVEVAADALIFLVENADLVTTAIGGMVGGALASKLIVPVINTVVSAWVAHKAATDGATISQWALNAAQSANPIGILVTATGFATAALVTYAAVAGNATTEEQKLLDKHKEELQVIKDNITARNESEKALDTEKATVEKLSEKLIKLNSQEKLSKESKSELVSVVGQLNTLMPELNLTIDEQTGLLNENNTEIKERIENGYELFVLEKKQEEITAIYEDQYNAQIKLAEKTNELKDAKIAETEAENLYAQAAENAANSGARNTSVVDEARNKYLEAKETVESYNGSIDDQNEVLGTLQTQLATATQYLKDDSISTAENGDTHIVWKDKLVTVNAEVATSVLAVQTAFDERLITTRTTLMEEIGLFELVSSASEISATEMAKNLASQTEAINLYKDNILIAEKLVEDGLLDEGMLGQIKAMGLDGAGYLDELVKASKGSGEELATVMTEFANMKEARESLATTLADIDTNYTTTMDNLLTSTTGMTTGVNEAILSAIPTFQESTGLFAKSAFDTMQKELNIVDGRSIKFQTTGLTVAESMAQGITNGANVVNTAMQKIIQGAVDGATAGVNFDNIVSGIDKALGERTYY